MAIETKVMDDRVAGRLNIALMSDVLFDIERWRSEQEGTVTVSDALDALIRLGLMSGKTFADAAAWLPVFPYEEEITREYRQPVVADSVAHAFEAWLKAQFRVIGRVPKKTEGGEALIKLGLMSGKTYEEAETLEPSGSG